MKELIERLESFDAHKQPMCTVHLDAAKAIKDLQAKLEAANQLAQLNGEIAASLKDERDAYQQAADALAAKLVPLTEFAEEFLEAWEEGMANDSYLLRMVQSTFKPDAAKGGQHDI